MTDCSHWEVISPEMLFYECSVAVAIDPPEPTWCWALVEAHSRRDAISVAVKHPDFREWVEQQRGDNASPFTGVRANRPRCEHGVCWACEECPTCLADIELEPVQ